MTLTAATLFSGIGAPEVAMPGWRWAWCAENEKFPSAVMAARHPNSVNLGDVTAHDFTERAAAVARPNVLVFGSPCQSFSIAGKRLGLDDPRGNLALVALGIVDRLKPGWFVFENVPGLMSSDGGRDFGTFIGLVDELRYSLCWARLDAQHFGVAQRRERVFAVGHLGDWRYPAAVLLEPESLCGDHPPRREAGQRPAPTIASRPTGGGGLGTDFDCDGGLIASHDISHPLLAKGNSSHRADAESYVAMALNAKGGSGRIDGESETFVTHALRADGFDASEDGTGRGTPIIAFSSKDHGADAGDIAPTLRAGGHSKSHANAGVPPAVAFQSSQSGFRETETHATLDANNGSRRHNGVALGSAVRRLMPIECEALQGFWPNYTLIQYRGKPAADGPRYKALGNSMAVPVIRWILNRIEIFETQVRPRIERAA